MNDNITEQLKLLKQIGDKMGYKNLMLIMVIIATVSSEMTMHHYMPAIELGFYIP